MKNIDQLSILSQLYFENMFSWPFTIRKCSLSEDVFINWNGNNHKRLGVECILWISCLTKQKRVKIDYDQLICVQP